MFKDKTARSISRAHKPEHLSLEQWQVTLRREFAKTQKFRVQNIGVHPVFSEFIVTNPVSKRSYRAAIRSERLGDNYCSCSDFSVNTLGTCKHIEFILARLKGNLKTRQVLANGFSPSFSEVFLRYGLRRQIVFSSGSEAPAGLKELVKKYFSADNILRDDAYRHFDVFFKEAKRLSRELRCYDDALDFIAQTRDADYRLRHLEKKFTDGVESPEFDKLLKVSLYPYQREGALFAAKHGRVLIGDDMGLGKTIQAIAAAEILAREFGIEAVLIICPTSLKYQWKQEIEKFCGRSVCVIEGNSLLRRQLYAGGAFFKIVNYDVVFHDLEMIAGLSADLVILDEAQRIKNWKTRAARSVKQIKSPFAIVLTGTPLENRIEELHSIVEFIDRHRLGPMFRFLANHQVLQENTGRVVGYRNLKEIGKTLFAILLRRKKEEVLKQLPEYLDKNFFVPMTKEQMEIHEENGAIAAKLAAKWKRCRFLSEEDRRRLLIALQYMRMACDNTYLIDRQRRFGPKIKELAILLEEIFEEEGIKAVIFSQWHRMTSLVEEMLKERHWGFVHLHGGVPGPKRGDLIKTLHENPRCRIFLSTDAGGLGLNLQSASVVVNLDLPWNPAVLEQRISRVHRLGQHRPVRVINFVSEGTIEHGMLSVLSFKKSLFAGVLDGGDDTIFLGEGRLNRFMQTVEEVTNFIPNQKPVLSLSKSGDLAKEEALSASGIESTVKPWQELWTAGAAFGQALAQGIRAIQKEGKSDFSGLLQTDEKTGSNYLKIPLPDKQLLKTALPALNALLETLKNL